MLTDEKEFLPNIGSLLTCALQLRAQHEHHQTQKDTTKAREMNREDHSKMDHDMDSNEMAPMSHAYSLNLPMNRNGSGTGWLPDASPMYGYTLHSNKWMYIIPGNVFIRCNDQDVGNKGTRGDTKVDAPNWFMAMGQRKVGQKRLFISTLSFLSILCLAEMVYRLLFQTGETYNDKPLVDRQHPHNPFSELSIAYTQSLTKDFDASLYLAYPGEPALGPVAFMHPPSSLNNLDSPPGHTGRMQRKDMPQSEKPIRLRQKVNQQWRLFGLPRHLLEWQRSVFAQWRFSQGTRFVFE